MTIAVFASCTFFLRMKKLTILEKNKLKRCIKENGGQIAFVLNQECTHVVTDDADALSPSHLKTIQKYELPVVNVDFIWDSIKERRLLQLENYELSQTVPCETGMEAILMNEDDSPKEKGVSEENNKHEWDDSRNVEKLRWFSDNNENIPYFPKEFEVAKYDVLEKITAHGEYVVVEIQCFQQQCFYPFCVSAHYSMLEGLPKQKRLMPTKTSEEARKIYAFCIQDLKKMDFKLRKDFPYQAEYLASEKLQEVLIADAVNSSVLSKEVGRLVELIWTEAVGHLNDLLDKPITRISFNDVSRAEGILLQAKEALDETKSPTELSTIISEFYKIIPHKNVLDYDVSKKLLSNKRDLCQLIRDMLNVYEINMSVPNSSSLSKYRALRCRIDALNVESEEFHNVKQLLDQNTSENPIQVLQIYKVSRITERMVFEGNLGNIQSLFHASSACNFVGILSRGFLLPKMVVEDYGLERTDIGYLGSGIYFSNSIRTSIKYSQPCETDGTRLLVICDVALGTCWETESHYCYSTEAPLGYDSVHGVSRTKNESSVFEDDEFVVYRTSQIKIKYVVQFSCVNDKVKEFQPIIQTELEDQMLSLEHHDQPKDYTIPSHDLLNDISAGLMDRAGNPIPLKDIRIKGRIIDFVAEVVVFQTYENETRDSIEAKYVFPLDDTAAVCGFEAFIKGKHIIGEVKEKEKAHQEYREAISRGDGAYLMDQDAPDIFTVSVGNLPPSTKVLIKISYITELSYERGSLCFHLPAAVAPWQQDKALNENSQDSVRKICIRQTETKREFSLEMSIEMPFKINTISSWTHQLKIKKTDCKAVVCTTEGSFLDTSGFAMDILIGDVYLPRMWIEKHPHEDSEACMLVFQPEFEDPFDLLSLHGEAVICLDCSNSMAGSAIQQAKEIALHALNSCHLTRKISVIKFGTNFVEFLPNLDGSPMDPTALKEFITSAIATMGDSNLWKALHYLSLLYPTESKRNIILISDGHIQNEGMTLQIVKKNATHTRIFTCGVGPTANRHMLRSLSQYGAGAFEYFDVKSKYNWERKMESQTTRMFSPRCSSISIEWQNYDIEKPELTYAPAQIQSLFNHERLLVYGFILNCTQAILKALVDKQELRTLVSTTELQKTTGTMLHKLAARAFIRDYEQGMLDENETEHEMKKQQLKSFIIELSLKNSIVTQFTSFVAIEKREADEDRSADTLDVLEPVAKEDVDILPYMEYSTELDDTGMLEHDFVPECDFHESAPYEVLGTCATNAMDIHSQNDTFDFDTQVQVSTQISPKTYSGSLFSYPPQPLDLNQLTLQSKYQSHQKLSSDLLEMKVSLCRSSRKEIAFEKPDRALVNKTVLLTKKKIIPKHQPAFHSEVEISNIFAPEKKVKRSAFHKRRTTASEMKLKTTHYAAKSSEEHSRKDTYPRSFRTPLGSVDWPQLFMLQNQDGFWQLTSALGILLDLDVHHLIHVSLAKKGIQSLGPKGKEKLLQLIATLLVLQAIYFKQLEGLIFKSLMKLKDSPPSWALNPVRKATEWANRTSREFPGICQCLELGKDWDDATKKLLGI